MRSTLFLIALFFVAINFKAKAEIVPDSVADVSLKWQTLSLQNIWLNTTNAAGLKMGNTPAIGRVYAGLFNQQGDFKRPQQPSSVNHYGFYSERYQPVKQGFFQGSFSFEQQTEKQIHWSDVMNPYRGTPYVLADSLGGDWRKQAYGLHLKMASGKIAERLTVGAGLNYNLSTGARQNDPRPLNYVNQLDFLPSAVIQVNDKNSLGVQGTYGFFKEQISLMNNKSELLQKVFKLKGLALHDAPELFTSSFSRLYDGRRTGVDMQYVYAGTGQSSLSWLTTFGLERYRENARDGVIKPTNGGTFTNTKYRLNSVLVKKDENRVQQWKIYAVKESGEGKEYHQTYDPVSTLWITTFEAVFYTASHIRSGVSWQITKNTLPENLNWQIRLNAAFDQSTRRYLYSWPAIQKIQTMHVDLDIKKVLRFNKGNGLLLSVNGGYQHPVSSQLNYTRKSDTANQTINEILIPDYAYLSSAFVRAGLDIQYSFSTKGSGRQFFIKGIGEVLSGLKSEVPAYINSKRESFALSIGTFY